jgi:hypothetical protein
MKHERGLGIPGEYVASAALRERSARVQSLATEPWNNVQTNACYTAPLSPMSAFLGKPLAITTLIMVLSAIAAAQEAANPVTASAGDLVRVIMNRSGKPEFVTLAVENRSSLTAGDVATAKKALENALRAQNVRLVKPERAVAEITVTISENTQGLLWIAEIKQGLTKETVMIQGARVEGLSSLRVPTLNLRRTLLYVASDDEPILDFIQPESQMLYLLRSQDLVTYKWDGARWSKLIALNFNRAMPVPRDTRGHLLFQQSQLVAYLPGMQCMAAIGGDGVPNNIQCGAIDDPWPLDNNYTAFFSPSRNFFSGIMRGGNFNSAVKSLDASVPPFYSAAALGESNAVWAFTGVDGKSRLYTSLAQAPRVYSGWGSDIASVKSGCGSQWQMLVSKPGDHSQRDAVQAMEIVSGEPVPASATVEISGPITSMWRSADGTKANVISKDATTGKYEASIFSIDCR